ncbi:MAG TPA: hypothetical protein VLV49_07995 [Terriglobales bacterium]|nr:hypothetical protein [Terriglobales bacterium]
MEKLERVIADLKLEDRRLGMELKRVRRALSVLRHLGSTNGHGRVAGAGPRRRLSAAARKRIADAQRARWAKFRAKKAA